MSQGTDDRFFRKINKTLPSASGPLFTCISCLLKDDSLLFLISKLFIMIPIFGETRKNTTFLEERLGLTKRKPSYRPTGTLRSPKFVLVWRSTNSSGSLSSACRLTHCTHWFLTDTTALPHWVVTRGSRWLVHKALYSLNVTKKGSMSNRRFLPGSIKLPEQELALSPTTIIIALMLIPESVLVQEGHTITKTRVESMHAWNFLIMEKDTLKPWDTSLCNDEREEFIPCYMISPFISINNHDYQHKNTYFATHHMAICALYDKH